MTSFDQVAASFWGTGGDDLLHDPLTDELVAEAEQLLGVALPTDLLDLLRIRNGAWSLTRGTPTRWARTSMCRSATWSGSASIPTWRRC
jgi:hypothetical protein